MHARIEDFFPHRDLGLGKHRIGRGLVARFPGEDMVGMRARAVADFGLVGDIGADDRRIGSHGLVRVDDGRQFLVVHFDRRRAIRGRIAIAGDDHGDFLHLEAHFLVGQHRLHVAADRRHPGEVDRLEIVRDQHRDDARQGQGLGFVDRPDVGMCVGTAHDRPEQHARQLDVVHISPLAANEARVFLAQSGSADTLQFFFARQRFSGIAHFDPPV